MKHKRDGMNQGKRTGTSGEGGLWMRSALGAFVVGLGLTGVGVPVVLAHSSQSGSSLGSEAIQLTRLWAEGRAAAVEAHFDPAMKSAAPATALAGLWKELVGTKGAYQETGTVQLIPTSTAHTAVVTVDFQKGRVGLAWSFSPTGYVTGLHLVAPPTSASSTAVWQRPSYDHPAAFRRVQVNIGSGFLRVPAQLDVPIGRGPFPGVVLIPGSGPENLNEQVSHGPEEPFRDLADGLASSGIVVLRYDKPTYANPSAFEGAAHVARVTPFVTDIQDAQAAAVWLSHNPDVKPGRVFLLGHSLGGAMAPLVARRVRAVEGLILLAAPARPLASYLVPQERYLAGLHGPLAPGETQQLRQLAGQVKRALSPTLTAQVPNTALPFDLPAGYWQFYQHYSATRTAASLHLPMLLLQGGRDYQVPPSDLRLWQTALVHHQRVTFHLFPGLDHLFVPVTGPSTPADYLRPGHVSPEVIHGIASWIHEQSPVTHSVH